MVLKFNAMSRSAVTQDMLDIMFSGGLSVELIRCLTVCVHTMPRFKYRIQQKLRLFIHSRLLENIPRKDINNMEIKIASNWHSSTFGLRNWFNSTISYSSHISLNSQEATEMDIILALQVLAHDDFFPKIFADDPYTR